MFDGNMFQLVGGSCVTLIHFALCLYAIVNIFGSRASAGAKVLWILFVFFAPFCGLLAWFFAGPRQGRGGY